jgi:hypothetical protein
VGTGSTVVVYVVEIRTNLLPLIAAHYGRATAATLASNSSNVANSAPSSAVVKEIVSWQLERRYRAFEQLRQALVQAHLDPPLLPPKSLLNNSNAEFLAQRAAGLDHFMKQLIEQRGLESVLSVPDFVTFVSESGSLQQISASPGLLQRLRSGVTDVPVLSSLERKVTSAISDVSAQWQLESTHTSLTPGSLSPLEEDVHTVRQLQRKWETHDTQVSATAKSIHVHSLPFHKFCVLLLGPTSSGKSAFCNWLFGIRVRTPLPEVRLALKQTAHVARASGQEVCR